MISENMFLQKYTFSREPTSKRYTFINMNYYELVVFT